MIYSTGTISISSQVITGIGTAWLDAGVRPGFAIKGVGGSPRLIAEVVSNTELRLAIPHADLAGVAYTISSDFTTTKNMPLPAEQNSDLNTIVRRAMVTFDGYVPGTPSPSDSSGTITVTPGSTSVVGNLTNFKTGAKFIGVAGDESVYAVASVQSATALTLAAAYDGFASGAGIGYSVFYESTATKLIPLISKHDKTGVVGMVQKALTIAGTT
jgi:hypothetical protein